MDLNGLKSKFHLTFHFKRRPIHNGTIYTVVWASKYIPDFPFKKIDNFWMWFLIFIQQKQKRKLKN